jgi:phosphohistidine phosphatase SixA
MIHLVRHADAGDRAEWMAPDAQRPLTELGWRQAGALARRLSALEVTRILSSPAVRCTETMVPLATAAGLEVVAEPALAEGTDPAAVERLIAEVEGGTVLCSHGDIVGNLIGSLAARGIHLDGRLNWPKASTWVLSRNGRSIEAARYVPPPDL